MNIRNLSGVVNATLGSASFGSVEMPAGKYCKSMRLQCRTAIDVHIAYGSDGNEYYTLKSNDDFDVDMGKKSGDILFWAKAVSTAPVLEILLFND
jgi:hypothetical protein